MPETLLFPSIEQRLSALIEFERRKDREAEAKKKVTKPTITISREFGCEAYPMAEKLKILLEKKTKEPWALMDKTLLEEVAKNNDLSEAILKSLGEKNRWLDEMLSTMSSRWKSEKDHYRMLSRQIVSLATAGNVILIGRGASIVTQNMKNCRHFRIYASMEFKTQSIAKRAKISLQDAELLVEKKQKQRDKFIKDFLDKDAKDLQYYNLIFNNDKNPADRIAQIIADYVTAN